MNVPPGIRQTAMSESEFKSLVGAPAAVRDDGPEETHTITVTTSRARFDGLMDYIRSHGIHGVIRGGHAAEAVAHG